MASERGTVLLPSVRHGIPCPNPLSLKLCKHAEQYICGLGMYRHVSMLPYY
jgi:hypothetical protein